MTDGAVARTTSTDTAALRGSMRASMSPDSSRRTVVTPPPCSPRALTGLALICLLNWLSLFRRSDPKGGPVCPSIDKGQN